MIARRVQRTSLHASLCWLFVLATGAVHLIVWAPAGAHAAYGIALRFLLAFLMFGAWATGRGGTDTEHRRTLVAGIAARLLVAPVSVSESHDVQRYLWDGAVLAAGLDPYRVAPVAPEAEALRAVWPTPPEHVAYSTIYPPGAVLLFGAAVGFGPSWAPWVWKLIIVATSLGTLWLGARTLKELGLSRHLALIAFSPLLVMETASGAHLDMVSALAVAAGLHFAVRGNATSAGIVLGAGGLVKFLPVLALVPLAARFDGRMARRAWVGAAVVMAAGYGVAFLVGLHPLGSLPVFFEKWRFGSPAFSALSAVLGDAHALRLVPFVAATMLLGATCVARWCWRGAVPLALAAPLLASPVVFPWYLAPLVPAVAMAPSAFALAWVTTIPLTNEVLDRWQTTGLWQPASWPLWMIAASWLGGIAIDRARRRRRARNGRARLTGPVPRISVIIPVLNEEARIGEQIDALAAVDTLHEIIVVDGGSTDRTLEIVKASPRAKALVARRSRAAQMNRGAEAATGDVLLFLHADVRLPPDAVQWIPDLDRPR